jgi:ribose transport system ATP-binding protein
MGEQSGTASANAESQVTKQALPEVAEWTAGDMRRAAGQAWVRVSGLSKTFGPAQVLRDVDLEVRSGEIHGLVGQNGSGKSTLIKILSGVHTADGGSVIEVDGSKLSNPVQPFELRRYGLAFVHQDLGLVGEQTVLENMRLGHYEVRRLSRRIRWDRERAAAQRTLTRLNATIDCDRIVNTLHAGEKAIVAIARAMQSLTATGGCIVFDESTQTLPRELLEDFYETVRLLAASGRAVIIVSHRLDEVLALADRVTVLQDGRVVAAGLPTQGLSEEALARLVLGRELEMLEQREQGTIDVRQAVAQGDIALRARGVSSGDLSSLDLDIAKGEVVGVTGATGSGHADIPYALAGVAPAASGTVTISGRDFVLPTRDPGRLIRAGVALVPEDRVREGLAMTLSASENLTLPRVRARGRAMLKAGWQSSEFDEAVEMLGIVPAQQHLLCSSFSGGNQQKLLLAKWLLNRPRVVLLHEPTQAVDIGARMDILRAIRATAALGVCVVISSIEPQDLAVVCDRVVVLRDGEIATELTTALSPEAITSAIYSTPAGVS